MIKLPERGILYHGSYTTITLINLSKCRSLIPQSFSENDGKISVFEFHSSPDLFIHCFEDADEEWLHFTACNRNSSLFPTLRKKYSSVDIIGGKVADDQTAITLNNYVAGVFGEPGSLKADRMAIRLLEPERLTDQFCFRTEEAISSLKYVRSYRYGDI